MDRIGIVFSKVDKASLNVFNVINSRLEEFFTNVDSELVELVMIDERSIEVEEVKTKDEVELYIFASKHSSKACKPSLLVHSVGNWGNADLGGEEKTVGFVNPLINKLLFQNLNIIYEERKNDFETMFDVTMEATHHGPYLEKPVVFLEIGSNEEEWEDERLGHLIVDVLKKSIEDYYSIKEAEKDIKCLFAVGGMHYAGNFNNIQKFNEDYAIGHICPKYYLENLDEESVLEVIEKTVPKIDGVVLDTKALAGEKKRLLELFDELGLRVYKYKELKIEQNS